MCSSNVWRFETTKVLLVAQISSFRFFSLLYFAMFARLLVFIIVSVDFRMTFSHCKEDSVRGELARAVGTRGVTTIGEIAATRALARLLLVNWYRRVYLFIIFLYLPFDADFGGCEIRRTHTCVCASVCLCEGERLIFNGADDISNG